MKRARKSPLDLPQRLTWPNGHSEVIEGWENILAALDKHGKTDVRFEAVRCAEFAGAQKNGDLQ